MKKKIITAIVIVLAIATIGISLTPQDVLAQIGSDIGGKPSTSTGGTGTGKVGYSMRLSTIIKVNLVDVSGTNPVVHDYQYYVYTGKNAEGYYKILDNTRWNANPNERGAFAVCGEIANGSYSSNCKSISGKMETTTENWFLSGVNWGTNVSASKIDKKLSDANFFAGVVNKLNIQSLIGGKNFDLATLTPEDIQTLQKYRLIVEPVYFMYKSDNDKYTIATVKGWAKLMIDEQRTNEKWGIDRGAFATNVYATIPHGNSINASGNLDISQMNSIAANGNSYYNTLANVNNGYGYGIFYVIGGCDPATQCCYDESGKYHEEYFETTTNFKCENGKKGKNCPTQVKACAIETVNNCPNDSGSEPGDLNCVEDAEFEQTKKEENIIANRTITKDDGAEHTHYWVEDDYDYEGSLQEKFCTDDLEQTITGNVTITQKGNFVNSLFPSSIYSGGGFSFEASYAGNASYQLCNELNYKIEQWKNDPKCPDISISRPRYIDSITIVNDGWQCKYEIYIRKSDSCCSTNTETGACESCSWVEHDETIYKDTIKNCAKQDDIEVTCKNGAWDIGCIEDKDGDKEYSEAFQTFAEKMADTFLEEPELIASTLSQDSNEVDDSEIASSSMGQWKVTESDIPNQWYPGEDNAAIYELEFVPWLSCINVRTAKVDYFPYASGDSCEKHETKAVEYIDNNTITYIDGERLYYVPLKEPDGSYFPVEVSIEEVSVLNIMNWGIEYKCGVECAQNLYNKKGNFKFIYRPIDMSNPFPKIVNENRLIGDNWKTFMSDKKAIESKMNRNGDNKEYTLTLTPTLISNIKTYNNNKNYTSLNTIYDSGRSDFLKDYAIEIMKKDNYNRLGYCTDECWPTMEVYGGEF